MPRTCSHVTPVVMLVKAFGDALSIRLQFALKGSWPSIYVILLESLPHLLGLLIERLTGKPKGLSFD